MSLEPDKHEVVVVGAGASGLYAARCLREEGLDVVVLEGRDHPGGRAYTWRDESSDNYCDLGGAYFGLQQNKAVEVIGELGLELYELPTGGDSIMRYKGSTTRYSGDLMSYNPLVLLDFMNVTSAIDKMSLQIPLDAPWTADKAEELDKTSIDDFLKRLCWTKKAGDLLRQLLELMSLSGSGQLKPSALGFLWDLRAAGGLGAQLESMKLKGGSNSISEKMAAELAERVIYNKHVTEIDQTSDGVLVSCEDGSQYKADEVIVALCPILLANITFNPPLTEAHQAFVKNPGENKSIKMVAYYERAYWTERGLSGRIISDTGLVHATIDDTKHDGSHPAILGFVDEEPLKQNVPPSDEDPQKQKMPLINKDQLKQKMSQKERQQAVLDQYAEMFGIEEMRTPLHVIEKDWNDEDGKKFSGKCIYSLPAGFLTKHRILWGSPHHRVKFAGTEASLVYRGYIDGALRAGEKAAKQVVESLGRTPVRVYPPQPTHVPYPTPSLMERVLPSIPMLIFILIAALLLLVLMVVLIVVFA